MGANIKAIKNRIKSVDSTMHLTNAMRLVASSKLKKATAAMEQSGNYADAMKAAFSQIMADGCTSSPFVRKREIKRRCFVVIAGDRGLAGGYNNNIFKLTESLRDGTDSVFLPIGKRSLEYFRKRGYQLISDRYSSAETISGSDCAEIGRLLCDMYSGGTVDSISLIYTRYASMLTQVPGEEPLLPIRDSGEKRTAQSTVFEPDPETVLDAAVPAYLAGLVYGAVCESFVCELSARRNAMDSAGKNAEEMIEGLNIQYNRARQGAITQEITEIIAGSEA